MDFRTWLEMPINKMQHLGNWDATKEKPTTPAYDQLRTSRRGYYKDDFGILTSQNAVEKIKRKWSKCEQPFDVYFLRSKEGQKQREVGEVSEEYLKNTLKVDVPRNNMAITIIYTNNIGAERMPMNWWTMAHRVGHAIARTPAYQYFTKEVNRQMYELLDQVYNFKKKGLYDDPYDTSNDQMLKALASSIGTMRSAREGLLRNNYEFHHELTAQYIIEGKIRFNPPSHMLTLSYAWGRPQGRMAKMSPTDIEEIGWNDYTTQHMAENLTFDISNALDQCIGKIFVM